MASGELNPDDGGKLQDWIASQAKRGSLPIYPLKFPETYGSSATPRRVDVRGASTTRRPDSGILELWRPERLHADDRLAQELIEMAVAEDPREFVRVAETGSEVIAAEWESSIAEPGLRVIGPGGRIMVAHEARGTTAEIVIRKRDGAVTSHWRSTDDLIASIARRIAERASGAVSVAEATFGYFELSKHERQEWLRPAFMVSIELSIDGDERIRWIETIVEPATESFRIQPADGFGSWFG